MNYADKVWISRRTRRRLKSMTFLRTSVRAERVRAHKTDIYREDSIVGN